MKSKYRNGIECAARHARQHPAVPTCKRFIDLMLRHDIINKSEYGFLLHTSKSFLTGEHLYNRKALNNRMADAIFNRKVFFVEDEKKAAAAGTECGFEEGNVQ